MLTNEQRLWVKIGLVHTVPVYLLMCWVVSIKIVIDLWLLGWAMTNVFIMFFIMFKIFPNSSGESMK